MASSSLAGRPGGSLVQIDAAGRSKDKRKRILLLLAVIGTLWLPAAALPATCKPGFVVREARSGDNVCVTPASKARVAAENARTPLLWVSGAFGHKTCATGFVWREAFVGDFTCVTSAIRALVQQENATAADRQM